MCSDLVINSTQTKKHDPVKARRVDLTNEQFFIDKFNRIVIYIDLYTLLVRLRISILFDDLLEDCTSFIIYRK